MSKVVPVAEESASVSLQLAYEEIRIHQEIVSRKEGNVFRIRGSVMALLTALAVAYFTPQAGITAWQFAAAGAILILASLGMEVLEYGPIRNSIERVGDLELAVRAGKYDGPSISSIVGKRLEAGRLWRELSTLKVFLPYGMLLLVVAFLTWVGPS